MTLLFFGRYLNEIFRLGQYCHFSVTKANVPLKSQKVNKPYVNGKPLSNICEFIFNSFLRIIGTEHYSRSPGWIGWKILLCSWISCWSLLTLPMLRLFSSKGQGCKVFQKPSKPYHVGIHCSHWVLSDEKPMCQGFSNFSRFFHHFVLAKLATSSISVKLFWHVLFAHIFQHLNEMACSQFEADDDVTEALGMMSDLVLPCLPLLNSQNSFQDDESAMEEIREKWCAFLGQEIPSKTKNPFVLAATQISPTFWWYPWTKILFF